MMIFYSLCEIVATFIESYLCYKFSDLFLKEKMNNKKCLVLSLILTCVIFIINTYSLFSISTLIIAVLFVSFTSKYFFKTSLFDVFCVSSFYSLLVVLFDFFIMSIMGTFLQNSSFASEVVDSLSFYRCSFLVLSKGGLLIGYFIIRKVLVIWERFKVTNLIFITILGYAGIIYFAKLTFSYIDFDIVINWFLLFLIILLTLYSLIAYIRYIREVDQKKLIEIKNSVTAEKYNNILKVYKENAQLYHDMKNHLSILDSLITHDEFEQSKQYIQSLADVPTTFQQIWTGNEIIDCIINLKKNSCEQFGIEMIIDADPLKLDIDDIIVSTIITNVLDNAIEACQHNSDKKKWVYIALRRINDIFLIKTENPVEEKLVLSKEDNGFLTTSKADKGKHGWGMKSIDNAVKKANGVYTFSKKDNKFVSVVTLFL